MPTLDVETHLPETSGATMNAPVWHGPGKPSWEAHTRPTRQHPGDAIVRITTSTIRGSDLHILKGDVLVSG
jgi:alcohol dehydrogenase